MSALVHRIEVRPKDEVGDSRGAALTRDARSIGLALEGARSARVYLIEGDLSERHLEMIKERLLADPVTEDAASDHAPARGVLIEVHPLPGVMDPAALSVREAISDLIGEAVNVSTGWRYDLAGASSQDAKRLAQRLLANPVIHAIHERPFMPAELPKGTPVKHALTHVPLRNLSDGSLTCLSRDAHLFLSLDEMKAIQKAYQELEREPTEIELETLAQTWSEHCVHKTFRSTIQYRPHEGDPIVWEGRPGHTVAADGTVTIENLLKSTIAAATHELIDDGIDWCLSIFEDNAGIIAFDEQHGICVKVETHNHPSAIEPYGGAATGIGGCIRDIMGTGLAAKPIASTDVFCVADGKRFQTDSNRSGTPLPQGVLSPDRVLGQVVAGVRDYGNRMGIPTVNGAVAFHDRYVANPLVFCGCIGIMPRDRTHGDARPGDRIIALGGRTGRDGIHGATFSSAELTDTHADEFAHAVQIGNPIEEKRTLDAILRARDAEGGPLFTAITDCGAGGFSSAVGEMGEKLGAEVHLDRAPLKYEGLTPTEIWISEAQERMVLAVPEESVEALRAICAEEHVECADLGHFGTEARELILLHEGEEMGRLPMALLHEGIPMNVRAATWTAPAHDSATEEQPGDLGEQLLAKLRDPNVASKRWIIEQYDHEVQGNTVVRPGVGPKGRPLSDASVIDPVPGSGKGLAVGCGLGIALERDDPYVMALGAVDECVRNLVCAGADPTKIAILDNFCWPGCQREEALGALVRAAEGCYDAAKAYRTPFVSGKDSLNNQFTGEDGTRIEIPPTLLVTGIGIVPDIDRCVTPDIKQSDSMLLLVGPCGASDSLVDLTRGPVAARVVHAMIAHGIVRSAHDVSDGGVLCAIAEMLIAADGNGATIGAEVDLSQLHARSAFAEIHSGYVLEIGPDNLDRARTLAGDVRVVELGVTDDSHALSETGQRLSIDVRDMARAWDSFRG